LLLDGEKSVDNILFPMGAASAFFHEDAGGGLGGDFAKIGGEVRVTAFFSVNGYPEACNDKVSVGNIGGGESARVARFAFS